MNLDVLFEDDIDVERLAEVLDGMGHPGRLATIRGWHLHHQARLYAAVKGLRPLTLAHFVPDSVGPLTEVIHWGMNSLPAFTHFQKRFCKPTAESKELYGYNENWHEFASSPGYFVLHEPESRPDVVPGELDIDYTKIPASKPESWPAIVPNETRLGRFIYAGMIDVMRGISQHVSIGRAFRGGKWTENYFVLCREDKN